MISATRRSGERRGAEGGWQDEVEAELRETAINRSDTITLHCGRTPAHTVTLCVRSHVTAFWNRKHSETATKSEVVELLNF